MALSFILIMSLSVESLADNKAVDPYAIPRDKSAEVGCLKAVKQIRPGQIFSFNVYNDNNIFHYQYEIEDHNNLWLVICDGSTQKIIKNELEDKRRADK